MGRHVDRRFICFLVHSYYLDRQNPHSSRCCFKCERLSNLLHEMGRWSFYDLNQEHNKWFVIFHKKKCDSQIAIFPVFI